MNIKNKKLLFIKATFYLNNLYQIFFILEYVLEINVSFSQSFDIISLCSLDANLAFISASIKSFFHSRL
jgi:hypothetical protein